MVEIMCKLRETRSKGGVFLASDGLITLRDLFRWGKRLAGSDYDDWQQCLSDHGKFCVYEFGPFSWPIVEKHFNFICY